MKRFTATWMTAVASALLLTAPATGSAQTPPPSTPPPATAQPPAAPPAGAAARADMTATDDRAGAQEHLRKASAALSEIKTATLPAKAKTQVAEIKRRLASLERTAAAGDKGSATGEANRGAKATTGTAGDDWGTQVAAIDKSLTVLLGPENTTGAAPAPTGTSGTAPAAGNKAAASLALDAEARASLSEVRKHLTAFATAKAGGKTAAKAGGDTMDAPAPAPAAEPSTAPAAPAATTPPASTEPPVSETPAAQTPTTQAGPMDEEAARRHLTEARNTLSALTQLPASAQLTGEARTQVAQLISNFNELITAQSEWRGSYAKVSANLTSLLGSAPTAADPANTSGTAGAVGTSGTASAELDPAVREKLVELRRNLSAFEKAAGAAAGATAPSTPDANTPETRPGAASSPATPATSAPTTSPTPTISTPTTPTTPAEPMTQGAAGGSNPDVARHVAAIEGLLKMQDDSGGLTLTKAQVEQLRTHWTALRQALDKK